jgi:hypothetical protein
MFIIMYAVYIVDHIGNVLFLATVADLVVLFRFLLPRVLGVHFAVKTLALRHRCVGFF